ncbi:MAG: hypothetical protein H6608_04405 [Flavobacteriales bacterium]|nr:hypothetical protein [Bacteroidota bacterium]MCB9240344.1 hypothetical protein [Flavobacteriales bacterium]
MYTLQRLLFLSFLLALAAPMKAQTYLNQLGTDTISVHQFDQTDSFLVHYDSTTKLGPVEVTSFQVVFVPADGMPYAQKFNGNSFTKTNLPASFLTLTKGSVLIIDMVTGTSAYGEVRLSPIAFWFK